jgi:hypothetical protein
MHASVSTSSLRLGHSPSQRELKGRSSSSTAYNPSGTASLAALLNEQQLKKHHTPQRTLAVSASTPGLRHGAATVQFANGAAAANSARSLSTLLPPMTHTPVPGSPTDLPLSPPAGPAESDEHDGVAMSMSAAFLSHGTDLNLADGIDQLEENMRRLLPRSTITSHKYETQVQSLLRALRTRANHAHAETKARKAALDAALFAQHTAEASERRYRSSVKNLALDQWGSSDQLRDDIRALEKEIVDRGRLTVEDAEFGLGLDRGIEQFEQPSGDGSRALMDDTGVRRISTSARALMPAHEPHSLH